MTRKNATAKKGRPLKRRAVIEALAPHELYTAAAIARLGVTRKLIPPEEQTRLRIAMGRFTHNHMFPKEGDGQVFLPGQPPMRGWFGWRFQEVLDE